jgi:hypothetical protein
MMEHVLRSIHCRTEETPKRQGYSCDSKCCCSSVTVSTSRWVPMHWVEEDIRSPISTYIRRLQRRAYRASDLHRENLWSTVTLRREKLRRYTVDHRDCMWLYRTRMFDYVHADVLLQGINCKTKTTYNVSWNGGGRNKLDVVEDPTTHSGAHRRYHVVAAGIDNPITSVHGAPRVNKKGRQVSFYSTTLVYVRGLYVFDHLYLRIILPHGWGWCCASRAL